MFTVTHIETFMRMIMVACHNCPNTKRKKTIQTFARRFNFEYHIFEIYTDETEITEYITQIQDQLEGIASFMEN